MVTKPKLLKPKAQTQASHNPELQALIESAKKPVEVPFQVRLNEDLATRVKVHCAKSSLTHKQLVTAALEAYLPKEK